MIRDALRRSTPLSALGLLALVLPSAATVAQAPAAPATGQQAPATAPRGAVRDVSGLLPAILERHHVPGMVAGVTTGEGLAAAGAAGVRKQGEPAPVTLRDRFHLGSCTKAMTATLAAMIVQDGKISWDTSVAAIFPRLNSQMDAAWRQATLEDFLQQRSGAPSDLTSYEGLGVKVTEASVEPEKARRLLLEGVLTRKPLSDPGSTFLYSNNGYAIAGAMLEEVTHKPWETLIRERLFEPLGMTSAGFGPPDALTGQPCGHTESGEPAPGADNPEAYGPAGTVHATLEDWAKFVALHLRGERGDTKLLPASAFRKLHTPPEGANPAYAMGWVETQRPWAAGRTLTHNGSNTVWYCVVWMAPNRDFAVLVACNQGGDEAAKACDEAASALINDYIERARPAGG